MNVYALRQVSFAYDGRDGHHDGHAGPAALALRDIDLTVAPGESLVLLGANASGKTTLLRLLAGLASPTSGAIDAFGRPLTAEALRDRAYARDFRRRVGFVFQNADAQLFSPTVHDEIAFGPLQLGLDGNEVERRVGELLALVGIEPLADRAPFHLSGGEKRKVAIAAVLAVAPEVLLLDEPTTGLDPRSRSWLVRFLRSLHQAGKTIITSTHDLQFAQRVGDRAVVLGEDHKIWRDGPIDWVLSDSELLVSVNLAEESSSVEVEAP